MIKFENYDRLFTFGCSMTRYRWPTWANLLGQEIPIHYNMAKSGGGNLYISNSVVEANKRYNFNKRDLVVIMWSSTNREDRYKNGNWETAGNIWTQGVHSAEWVSKWADERFYLIRDLALMELTQQYLEHIGIDHHILSMGPIPEQEVTNRKGKGMFDDIKTLYKDTLSKIRPDICTTVYNGVWPQTPIQGYGQTADYHPTPLGHLKYLAKIFPGMPITEKMRAMADEYEKIVLKCKHLDDLRKYWDEGNHSERL